MRAVCVRTSIYTYVHTYTHTYYVAAGNDYIHDLTSNRQYELRVDLDDFENESRYAVFSTFAVASEADKYAMTLGTYNGTAGNISCTTHCIY